MIDKLTVDAIRARAVKLAKRFEGVSSEKQHDQNFMRAFCEVFGVDPNRIEWQFKVKQAGQSTKWGDGLLPGMALFEMKSRGEDLDAAYEQASKYIALMPQDWAVPQFVIISDFATVNVHVRATGERHSFSLSQMAANLDVLLPLAGYEARAVAQENEANEAAAEKIGRLHDRMKADGYSGVDLESYLVRLLFCLFADDTGLFGENHRFLDLLRNTRVDGSNLHDELVALFETLNTAESARSKNLPERFRGFPYVNGDLFAGGLARYYFDEDGRRLLLELAEDDWRLIKPSIFGSLFQAIMHHEDEGASPKSRKRRELGAHYTSETNILKVIRPLFLDDLWAEFEQTKRNRAKLGLLHDRLAKMQFFDPACGCGNFLVVAYRELRLLELAIIEQLYGGGKSQSDVALMVRLDVDQFHGIEIDSTAARIATVAMWLTDHQMNLQLERLGSYMHRLPLTKRPNIHTGNALKVDWATVLPPSDGCVVMGNPPFLGYSNQSAEQRADLAEVFRDVPGAGVLDYVAGWYAKAAMYIQGHERIPVAFVSTNSITQGEQVAVLWRPLMTDGLLARHPYQRVHIHFAHRTFRWSNEGRGIAAVHCVIVGFGLRPQQSCRLYDYETLTSEPVERTVGRINAYLVDAPEVFIEKRRKPIGSGCLEMVKGSQPTDGGNLLLRAEEAEWIKANDPIAAKYIRSFLGAEEFINNLPRYCLWLLDSTAQDRAASTDIQRRMSAVRAMRLASPKLPTKKLADVPYLFGEIRRTGSTYLIIPRHSSEQRVFLPIGYSDDQTICGDANFVLPNAGLFEFGVLCSTFHNAWMRAVCGRIKSDYRYSNTIVYNNFPWPSVGKAQREKVCQAAQAVLDARTLEEGRCAAQGQSCSLADLYAPGNMPRELLKAHEQLDKAVDAAYASDGFRSSLGAEADRVAFLLNLYQLRVAAD
ncbi:class I SAM-dependent DNA methyltransferase [Pseudomonas indoloxydans]|uniref:site-specific DNA-methyltransferase (adenine-specific) n=1 Tax=Ectopseudomonas oleovorans TaxID=301 RepID=A0A2T5PS31_ECTOL|nr:MULTISPECIES: DNA methyltransferase [Pseudomonas]PPV34677.1 SAM-dependent methyltransferase [Pseudomonas oleovorans]PTU80544.1 class I SAM-dependent DNA methyltransferase [Pseudomonas indoloxydans]